MLPDPYSYTAEFKTEVIRALLYNLAVTTEFSTRYDVPPELVRRWVRQTITQLDAVFGLSSRRISGPELCSGEHPTLSASELKALLADFDHHST